jgi:hypothetical protein
VFWIEFRDAAADTWLKGEMSLLSPPDLVVRPHRPQAKPGALFSAAAWCAMSVAFLARFHGTGLLVVTVLDLGVFCGGIAILCRSRARSVLNLTGDDLTWSGAFRDRKVCPVKVVEAEVRWSKTAGLRTRVWLLVNAEGRAEVNLNLDAWDRAQLEQLRQRLGIPRGVISEPQSGKQLHGRFPGSVPAALLHPIALTYLLIAAITVCVLVARHS